MSPGTIVGASMVLTVIIEAIDRYNHSMFWPSQVLARWGVVGIAFILHLGMWGDATVLAYLCRWLVDNYANQWFGARTIHIFSAEVRVHPLLVAGIGGIVITGLNQTALMFGQKIPDPNGWQKEWFSLTIVLHYLLMSTVVAIALLVCFFTETKPLVYATVGIVLALHMMCGIHLPLGIAQRFFQWQNIPDFLANPVLPYFAVSIWIAIIALVWYAGGRGATAIVTGTAIAFGAIVSALWWLSLEQT